MPNIATFILCDSVEYLTNPNPLLKLVNPIYMLRPKYIPGIFSFGIAFGIEDIKINENHEIQIIILSPDKKEVHKSQQISYPLPSNDPGLPLEYQGFMFAMDIRNLELPSEGGYICTIYIDKVEVGSKKFGVFKAPQNI